MRLYTKCETERKKNQDAKNKSAQLSTFYLTSAANSNYNKDKTIIY